MPEDVARQIAEELDMTMDEVQAEFDAYVGDEDPKAVAIDVDGDITYA